MKTILLGCAFIVFLTPIILCQEVIDTERAQAISNDIAAIISKNMFEIPPSRYERPVENIGNIPFEPAAKYVEIHGIAKTLDYMAKGLSQTVTELKERKINEYFFPRPADEILSDNLNLLWCLLANTSVEQRKEVFKLISPQLDALEIIFKPDGHEIVWFNIVSNKVKNLVSIGDAEQAFNYIIPFFDKYKNPKALLQPENELPENTLLGKYPEFTPYILRYVIKENYWIPWEKQLRLTPAREINFVSYKLKGKTQDVNVAIEILKKDISWVDDLPEIDLKKADFFPGSEVPIRELEKDQEKAIKEIAKNYLLLRLKAWEDTISRLEYFASFVKPTDLQSNVEMFKPVKDGILKDTGIIKYLESLWIRKKYEKISFNLQAQNWIVNYEIPPFKYSSHTPARFYQEGITEKGKKYINERATKVVESLGEID